MLIPARSLDTMLFFSDRGKVYSEKVYQIPDADRTAKGIPLVNVLALAADERVTAAIAVSDFSAHGFCMLATVRGKVKRVVMEEFAAVRPSGLIAMTLEEGDTLGWARLTSGKDEVIFVTENGQALRFNEKQVRSMGRQAAGVHGIRLAKGDAVTSMDVVDKDGSLLVVTTGGYGKQTPLSAYTAKGRGNRWDLHHRSKGLEGDRQDRCRAGRSEGRRSDDHYGQRRCDPAEGQRGEGSRARHQGRPPHQAPAR